MKIIAIYFSDEDKMGYPFDKSYYFETYQQIISDLEEKGLQVFIVRGASYLGSGDFKKGWQFKGGELVESDGEVQVDLIFNRDDKNTIPQIHDCKIINQPEIDNLCLDKLATAKMFPEISPLTKEVKSFQEFLEIKSEWGLEKQDMVVLKKNFLTEGRGIYILEVNKVKKDLYENWKDVFVQEFLDSVVGIEGIVKRRHDLRVNVVNGKPINAYIRMPKEGTYLANVAKGGGGKSIKLEELPEQVLNYVEIINKKLAKYFPSVYSADFLNSPKGFKLVEMNSRPMVQHPKWFKDYKKFNNALVEMLVEAVK